ncbi:MAG: PAS domain-containing protein [Planctomycetes bacterium]|nr:PAS domain-containing protein [Planctomycetota bacterium]
MEDKKEKNEVGNSLPYSRGLDVASFFDNLFEGVQIIDFDWRYVYLNEAALVHAKRSFDELRGRTMEEMYPGIGQTEVFGAMKLCMDERVPQHIVNLFTYPDGSTGWFDLRVNPVDAGILVFTIDITKEKRKEEELRMIKEDLSMTLECMAEGVVTTDMRGIVTRMNLAAESLTGWIKEEWRGRHIDELLAFISAKTGLQVKHPVELILSGGLRIGLANDTVLITKLGDRIPIASSGAPLRDAEGNIRGVVMVIKDMKDEYELGAMLNHSQKMEAIGRLSGGIAHDFNNLLSVITGYADLILFDGPEDCPFRDELSEIRSAAYSAAMLTKQLLAFSRKQVLAPKLLNLNDIVNKMAELLRRLIGEDVDFRVKLGTNLESVMFDAGQLEQILMNLAVNARDAMPSGGKLLFETANVDLDEEYARKHADAQPGPHVMLAISDTGFGMTPEVREKIFDPFFTTKELGRGTGLGLSTVYGIVKQSGGNIWVYSEPGKGTTFKVYIPVANRSRLIEQDSEGGRQIPSGTETILVAEDEDSVRKVVVRILKQGGYNTLDASNANEAIEICRTYEGVIDLLLTDVILPGKGGKELSGAIKAMRPDIRVVFMSGYTDNAIVHHGVLDEGVAFIEKPISPKALLEKIAEYKMR